jgi:hypothetical protein
MLLQAIIPKEMKRFIFPLLAAIIKASAPKKQTRPPFNGGGRLYLHASFIAHLQ